MPTGSLLRTYLEPHIDADALDALGSLSVETIAFAAALDAVAEVDPAVAGAVLAELHDQRRSLKLIASENYASPAVLLAMGNWMSDKYAEGVPGHRFYAGCDNVDTVEGRAARLACELFGAEHAYAQPHSGIDANLVAYWAVLTRRVERPFLDDHDATNVDALDDEAWEDLRTRLGTQTVLGMALDAGGHLTHGYRPNVSGKLFRHRSYTVDEASGLLDYDHVAERARQERPLLLVAGYSSYPRRVNFRIMREIADDVGATFMVDMAHFAGLVAGGVLTGDDDPVGHAHIVTTTTHKTLRGPRGGLVLCNGDLAEFVDRGCPLVLGGPLPHVIAAKAVALGEAATAGFADHAHRVVANARALAAALVEGGVPVLTGGTDNHLVMVDVRAFRLTGRQAETALRECGITTNRNVVPRDPNGPWYTSGLRLGTPALTTLGMGETEMREVGSMIARVLAATTPGERSRVKFATDARVADEVRSRAADLLAAHRPYPGIAL